MRPALSLADMTAVGRRAPQVSEEEGEARRDLRVPFVRGGCVAVGQARDGAGIKPAHGVRVPKGHICSSGATRGEGSMAAAAAGGRAQNDEPSGQIMSLNLGRAGGALARDWRNPGVGSWPRWCDCLGMIEACWRWGSRIAYSSMAPGRHGDGAGLSALTMEMFEMRANQQRREMAVALGGYQSQDTWPASGSRQQIALINWKQGPRVPIPTAARLRHHRLEILHQSVEYSSPA